MRDFQTAWDVRQGLPIGDPAAATGLDFREVESWFDDESLDGPTSLTVACENIDINPTWVRRKIGEWRAKREAGGTDRLVPPQHP